ncbi:MAG: hypothetical protein M3483_08175, partial [Gemmatimonadota bacterium]|nr:hypothetical protein [Gemmatimonadota bacterium]
VYYTLLGYSAGLVAATGTRLFSSAFFALRDTRTPARIATLRVGAGAVLGFVLMVQFEGIDIDWFGLELAIGPGVFADLRAGPWALGAVGLASAAAIGAWVEWILLRNRLRARIGPVGAPLGAVARMAVAALAGAAVGWGIRIVLPPITPLLLAAVVVPAFGAVYFLVGGALGLSEAGSVLRRMRRMLAR